MDKVLSTFTKVVLLFLYAPIVAVIVYSFNSSPVSYKFEGVSLKWYVQLFGNTALMDSLKVSAIVGLAAAAMATAIGLCTAIALARFRVRGKGFFLAAVLLPLVIPEIVIGVSLLAVFSTAGMTMGLMTLILGHVVITLPMTSMVLIGAMGTMDPSLNEAATDLGATPWQIFIKVLLPLLKPSLMAAFLLSFTTSFSNIVISTFTAGVGTTTLPLRIYSTLRTGLTPELNALGALLVGLTLAVILVVGVSQMRRILAGPVTN